MAPVITSRLRSRWSIFDVLPSLGIAVSGPIPGIVITELQFKHF